MSKNRLTVFKSMGAAALLGAVAIFNGSSAIADTVSYTTSLISGDTCTGCGPFGTIMVSSVSGHSNELSVTLDLTSGEVFANTGAGSALLFDISGNPALSASSITTGFSLNQASNHADGSGNWNTYISCDVCGSGTSPPRDSGPLSFILSVASGTLTPSSFVTNGSGYLFASDIGVPKSGGSYNTGDVATVPLPAAAWLLLSGLAGMGAMARLRRRPDRA